MPLLCSHPQLFRASNVLKPSSSIAHEKIQCAKIGDPLPNWRQQIPKEDWRNITSKAAAAAAGDP